MDTILSSAALAIFLCALAAFLSRRIGLKTYNGAAAIANGMCTVANVIAGSRGSAMFSAGCTALCAFLWWTSGGAWYSPPSSFSAAQVHGRAPYRADHDVIAAF